eukprot:gnl/MRDRNA2_/MRDRNA2_78861_c0_seq2.p1 gnl/MRDRNA2_/MRDRNA2_78861_c0~~gnl/MRDRNA2_/MRDRNA2_78861_c0_seq2.p1  ORF type:complete len:647 (-),score=82.69 gnl/MRDRNA2_/MRDRNA2_78861_c0_seq2:21-1961(-)
MAHIQVLITLKKNVMLSGFCGVFLFDIACSAAVDVPKFCCPDDASEDAHQFLLDVKTRFPEDRKTCLNEATPSSHANIGLISFLQTAKRKSGGIGLSEHKTLNSTKKSNSLIVVTDQDLESQSDWAIGESYNNSTSALHLSQKDVGMKALPQGGSLQNSQLWLRVGLVVLIFTAIIFFGFHVAGGSKARETWRVPYRHLQTMLFLYICLFMSSVTVVIPASSALMHDLGLGATASGVLIGCAWPLSAVVAFLMKPLVQHWDQSRVRRILLVNYALQALGTLAFALASDPPAAFGMIGKNQRLAVFFISRLIVGISGGSDLLLNVMVWKVVPAKETVSLEVNKTYCRILAIGLGPLAFSLVCWATGASNPRTHSAHPAYAYSLLWLIFGILASVALPEELTSLIENKEAEDNMVHPEATCNEHQNTCNIRALPEKTRRSIWFAGMFYGFERALMISALEAATSLIIEMEFGWNVKDVGLAVSMTFFIGLPFAQLLNIARESSLISEARLMSGAAVTSVVASVLLFPSIFLARALQAQGLSAVISVLVADCFIFTSRYLANGIVDGLAVQSSLPGTFYSVENFRLCESLLQDSLARFMGPIIARYLIAYHGRAAYSIFQLCVSSLGCLTLLAVASKMWLPDSFAHTDK